MANYISYSLFGDNPRYYKTALKCLKDADKFFRDWNLVFYVDEKVPKHAIKQLQSKSKVIFATPNFGMNGMLWRYQAIFLNDAERVIFRDADSRLLKRDSEAVREWIDSQKIFHILRDHPLHQYRILGGMFGLTVTEEIKVQAKKLVSDECNYGEDIKKVESVFYDSYVNNSLIHASFHKFEKHAINFPKKWSWKFVGEVEKTKFITFIMRLYRIFQMMFRVNKE